MYSVEMRITVKHKKNLSRLFRNITIKKRLLFLITSQILIMIVLFFILIIISFNDVKAFVNTNNTKWISIISQEFETAISSLEAVTKYPILSTNAQPNLIHKYLSSPKQYSPHILFSELNSNRQFLFTQHPHINLVNIYDTKGSGVSISNHDKYSYSILTKDISLDLQNHFVSTILEGRGKCFIWSSDLINQNMDNPNFENNQIIGARAIINTENFGIIGVIIATADMSNNIEIYENGKIYENQKYGIFDLKGNHVLGDLSVESFKKFQSHINSAKQKQPKQNFLITTNLNGNFYHYTYLDNGFYCIMETPIMNLIQNAMIEKLWIFLLLILITIIFIYITEVIVLSITRPITKLTNACTDVRDGNFSLTIKDDYKDELSTYISFFNSMTLEINRLIQEVYQKDLSLAETEMDKLRSQINPHSLYNTLEIIKAMAMMRKQDDIANMVKLLGVTLRYGVSSSPNKVTVAHEFEILQYYIQLQNYLYQDRIQFITYMDENIKEIPILKLIVQPLVENAILHGAQSIAKGGLITVLASKDEDDLIFKIIDNGCGMQEETVSNLQDYIDNKNNLFKGIGLKNVNRRIKLYYGESYGVSIHSSINKGTMMTVRIPIQEE